MRARCFAASMALTIGALTIGHAEAATPGDPFERVNRKGFAIQEVLDRYFVGPAGGLYRMLTPGPIGKAIHHILINLTEPVVVINDMLQLRPARAGAASVRFVVNSTVGLAGMIDVTGQTGLPHRPSSFGDTLGRYGVKPGPYLFLPLVGPSTMRDLFGNLVDATIDPLHFAKYPFRKKVSIAVAVAGGLDQWSSSEGDLRALLSDAADPYATLRSAYLQHREAEVRGDTSAPGTLPDLDAPDTASPSPSAALDPGQAGLVAAPALDQAPTFGGLPDGQDRQPHGQFAGPLDEGERQGKVRPQAEQWAEQSIAGLLNADAHRSDEDRAAHGHDQGLQAQNVERTDGDARDAKREPRAERAGDPGAQVDEHGQEEPAGATVKKDDHLAGLGGGVRGGWQDTPDQSGDQPHAAPLDDDEGGDRGGR